MATRIPIASLRLFSSTFARPTPSSSSSSILFAASSKSFSSSSSTPAPPSHKPITDLFTFNPSLDIHPKDVFTPPLSPSQKHPSTIVYVTNPDQPIPASEHIQSGASGEDDVVNHLSTITELTPGEIRNLYRFPLIVKRVVSMKSKGKMPSMYAMVVVGNGNGLVGVGEGNDDAANRAVTKAFSQAVRSMDFVERYDDRTVWGDMESNFGSCKIQMRSRPPGFGLRVNHYIHQVAKAAGISDLSAKVYGSRNGSRVIKLAVQMLHGGSVPVDMGDAFGSKGQRRNKKKPGMRTAEEIGRARGRMAISL